MLGLAHHRVRSAEHPASRIQHRAWLVAIFAFLALANLSAGAVLAQEETDNSAEPVSYYRDVWPILQRRCQGCHQPAKAGAQLVVTRFDLLLKGGEEGPVIEPGDPFESLLVEMIEGEEPLMPQNQAPLSNSQIAIIKRWIAEGAKDDTPPAAKDPIDPDHPPVYRSSPVISAVAYSPDGQTLAVSGYREVLLHRADGSGLLRRLVGLSHRIESLAYSPDGKILAAIGGAPAQFGEVQLWDTETNKLVRSEMLGYDVFYGASFSRDGKRLAFGSADKTARIIDVATGKQLVKIDQHEDWCFGAAFSSDGKYVVTPGRDRHLKLMESDTGSFIDNITSITPGVLGGPLYCVARHPQKNQFLTGGEDGIPKLYRMLRTKARKIGDDFNLIRNYPKQPGRITSLAFSKDGSKLAVGSFGGEVGVYQVGDAKEVAVLRPNNGAVHTVAFHPDGTQLAVGGFDGRVRLFDIASGELEISFVPVPVAAKLASQVR